MPHPAPLSRLLALGLLLAIAAGCGSTDPARFYLLTPVAPPPDGATEALPVSVRLAPVDLPRYLAVPEMVTRSDGNRVERAEYDRWAEPLERGFQRVLAANLALLVPTDRVFLAPWDGSAEDERVVRVSVERFDVEDGRAVLAAGWSVAPGARSAGEAHRSRHEQAVAGDDYAAVARALSEVLGQLSLEIARAVRP